MAEDIKDEDAERKQRWADVHEEAIELFARCEEEEADNRVDAEDDLRFARLSQQWPEAVRRERELENRPCQTFNLLAKYIRQVVNDARLNRPSIRVLPVDSGADPDTAEVLNGLIRNIETTSKADIAYDTAVDNAVSMSWGYVRVTLDYAYDDSFDLDIRLLPVENPFTIYGDPDKIGADTSDWNVSFVTEMISEDEFKRRYPKADTASWESDDRDGAWFKDGHVRVAEFWRRKPVTKTIHLLDSGKVVDDARLAQLAELIEQGLATVVQSRQTQSHQVTQFVMNGVEVLEENAWPGQYIPISVAYGDMVNIDGKRVLRSLIRDAKDAQQSYNYWRTSANEKCGLDIKSPFVGAVGAFDTDRESWNTANNVNHPFLEYDPVPGEPPPKRMGYGGVPAGDMAMAATALDDVKHTIGLFDASMGQRSNETSGIAIRERRQEGDVGTFHFVDNLARCIRHLGCIVQDLIPHVYTGKRIIRVLGEDGQPADMVGSQQPGMVPINQPFEVEGLTRVYDLTAGKYDVVVRSGPGFSTRRQESASQMVEMVRAFPALFPVAGDKLVRNMDWPGADEIAERLERLVPPQAKGDQGAQPPSPDQVRQLMQGMQQMQAQLQQMAAEREALQRKLDDKSTENQIKGFEARIKGFEAETDRMRTWAELNRPPEPPPSHRAPPEAGPEPVF